MKLAIDITESRYKDIQRIADVQSDFQHFETAEQIIARGIPIEQEPCEDCISRAELLKAIDTWDKFGLDDTNHLFRLDNLSLPHYVPYIHYDDVIKCIKGMPSVQPKTEAGHWLRTGETDVYYDLPSYECDKCGQYSLENGKYCPNCGCLMVEQQESEE